MFLTRGGDIAYLITPNVELIQVGEGGKWGDVMYLGCCKHKPRELYQRSEGRNIAYRIAAEAECPEVRQRRKTRDVTYLAVSNAEVSEISAVFQTGEVGDAVKPGTQTSEFSQVGSYYLFTRWLAKSIPYGFL